MNPHPVHRLPPALENAVQRIKHAARAATERTIESLGLAALATNNVFQRDVLLGGQFELNRKSAIFALAFNEAFDQRLLREVAPRSGEPGPTSWDALSLVEDRELELEVAAERFALEIAHASEWELRELGAYVVSLLGPSRNENERNPLRPEIVGHAMVRAIEDVSERAEVRKVLTTELGRSLGGLLRQAYADIVSDLRQAGFQPVGLTVRTGEPRGPAGGAVSGYDTLGRPVGIDADRHSGHNSGHSAQSGGYGGQAAAPAASTAATAAAVAADRAASPACRAAA